MSKDMTVQSFYTKDSVVEAVQFNGHNNAICLAFCPAAVDPATDGPPCLLVPTLCGMLTCNIGDWIVENCGGNYTVLDSKRFTTNYIPLNKNDFSKVYNENYRPAAEYEFLLNYNASILEQNEQMQTRIDQLTEELSKPDNAHLLAIYNVMEGRETLRCSLAERVKAIIDSADTWRVRSNSAERALAANSRLLKKATDELKKLKEETEEECLRQRVLYEKFGVRASETIDAFVERLWQEAQDREFLDAATQLVVDRAVEYYVRLKAHHQEEAQPSGEFRKSLLQKIDTTTAALKVDISMLEFSDAVNEYLMHRDDRDS